VIDSDRLELPLAANATQEFEAFGNKAFVASSSFPFKLKFGGGPMNLAAAGLEYNFGERTFNNLTIKNIVNKPLSVVIWTGTALVRFNFPTVPATRLKATKSTLAGGAAVTLSGVALNTAAYTGRGIPIGARRKQWVVSNRSNTNDLLLKDEDGNEFGVVNPNDDYTLESDDTILVSGTNGDVVRAAEVFYLNL
jgi:hypothetical protein